VVVAEIVYYLEKDAKRLRIAVGQVGILENSAKKRRNSWVLGHPCDGFGVEVEGFVAAKTRAHELGPAVARELAREEAAQAAQLFALRVHVVHELVDEGYRDLFDLALGVGHLAHEDVPRAVDSSFCVGIQHFLLFE